MFSPFAAVQSQEQLTASPFQEYQEYVPDSSPFTTPIMSNFVPQDQLFSNQEFQNQMYKLQNLPNQQDFTIPQEYSDLSFPQIYPNMLSPPGTPAMSHVRTSSVSSMNGFIPTDSPTEWGRQRSDSVSWNPPQHHPHTHTRAMSLPHLGNGEFDLLQMDFSSGGPQRNYSRKSSIASSTGSEKTLVCSDPGCDRTFSRIQNLRSHMRCHLITTPHNCKSCGLGFRRTTDLQRHVRTMHLTNEQKPWGCSRCTKRFGRRDALKRFEITR